MDGRGITSFLDLNQVLLLTNLKVDNNQKSVNHSLNDSFQNCCKCLSIQNSGYAHDILQPNLIPISLKMQIFNRLSPYHWPQWP